MFKDIFTDIWLNYRGRFLCSLSGVLIASLFLTIGFWRTLFLLLFAGGGFFIGYKPAEAFLSATSLIKKKTWQSGWTGCCRRAIINSRPA